MATQHRWEFDDMREWLGELGIPGVLYQIDEINFFFDTQDNGPDEGWKEIIRW